MNQTLLTHFIKADKSSLIPHQRGIFFVAFVCSSLRSMTYTPHSSLAWRRNMEPPGGHESTEHPNIQANIKLGGGFGSYNKVKRVRAKNVQ